MLHFTVLIPQRDAGEAVARQLPGIWQLLDRQALPYEVILIDDGSGGPTLRMLKDLQSRGPLRLLKLDRPCGTSAALTAGMLAARGEIVVAIEAGNQYVPDQILWLVERLARADLVFGRRSRSRWRKIALAALQVPRRVLLGLESRDPDCLFWAARREAIQGLELADGMHRFLGTLVSMRGFRVGEINVHHRPQPPRLALRDSWRTPANLLASWWLKRSWQAWHASEIHPSSPQRETRPATRIDPPQPGGHPHSHVGAFESAMPRETQGLG